MMIKSLAIFCCIQFITSAPVEREEVKEILVLDDPNLNVIDVDRLYDIQELVKEDLTPEEFVIISKVLDIRPTTTTSKTTTTPTTTSPSTVSGTERLRSFELPGVLRNVGEQDSVYLRTLDVFAPPSFF